MAPQQVTQQITALHITWLIISGISIYFGIKYGHRILGGFIGAAVGGVCGAAAGFVIGWVAPMVLISIAMQRKNPSKSERQ